MTRPLNVAIFLCTAFITNVVVAQFIPLGDFPEGAFSSGAAAISSYGTTVVGAANRFDVPSITSDAFRWTETAGMMNLETFPQVEPRRTRASSVSAAGDVIVGYILYETGAISQEAFRWAPTTGIVGLGFLPGGSSNTSVAADVSDDGSAIVGTSSSHNSLSEAFVWTPVAGMVGLGDLHGGDFSSVATGITADGDVIVGGSNSLLGPEAFRWTAAEGMIPLGDLPGGFFSSGARAVSSDGNTVVGYGNSEQSGFAVEAFRWTAESGMQPLGDLPGGEFISDALGVSSDGSVVLGYSERDSGYAAFAWDVVHGMRDLSEALVSDHGLGAQLAGWRLIAATDISDDGLSIVGYGANPDGNTEAWLVRLDWPLTVPEPAALVQLAVASLAFVSLRLRQRNR
jgi:probable HAF family extracellular repeat protein